MLNQPQRALGLLVLLCTAPAMAQGTENWWEQQRSQRSAALEKHLAEKSEDFAAFRDMPGGTLGVPMVMFRLYPELFPQYWGPDYAFLGLRPDPMDDDPLPLGLGHIESDNGMRVVGMTCATCHVGQVTDEAGNTEVVWGAPANEFDYHFWRSALTATALDPNFTADNFRQALAAKAPGWVYQDPAMAQAEAFERGVFNANAEAFIAGIKQAAIDGANFYVATLGSYTYHPSRGGPSTTQPRIDAFAPGVLPGQMDAYGGYAAMSTAYYKALTGKDLPPLDEVLAPYPAVVDQMYLWNMGDRPNTKWGGEVVDPWHSLAGAAMGMVGSPFHVNMEAVNASISFAWDLPATPYPFPVDADKAAIGRGLFQQHCSGCHQAGSDRLFPAEDVGTDPNRTFAWTPVAAEGLREMIRIACSDPATCTDNGTPIPDDQVITITQAYADFPLDGIWARAPYLHNGSVPTLRHLLTGERPTEFWRGNTTYDQDNVGFTWDQPTGPKAMRYDTSLSGNGNGGHDTPEYLGDVDWANEPDKLENLLEFLKTL